MMLWRLIWASVLSLCIGVRAGAVPITRELVEANRDFLELPQVWVTNRQPRMDCRVDHPVLGNLVIDGEDAADIFQVMIGEEFRFALPRVRTGLRALGIDPDYPEPLEVWSCSLYEILKRYVNGEPVQILKRIPPTQEEEFFTAFEFHDIGQLTLVGYWINGEREYTFDEQGRVVFPWYLNGKMLQPFSLMQLVKQNPKTEVIKVSVTLQDFFKLLSQQGTDVRHEIWGVQFTTEDNLNRRKNFIKLAKTEEYNFFAIWLRFLNSYFGVESAIDGVVK